MSNWERLSPVSVDKSPAIARSGECGIPNGNHGDKAPCAMSDPLRRGIRLGRAWHSSEKWFRPPHSVASPITYRLCLARVMATFSRLGLPEAQARAPDPACPGAVPSTRNTISAYLPWKVCTVPHSIWPNPASLIRLMQAFLTLRNGEITNTLPALSLPPVFLAGVKAGCC